MISTLLILFFLSLNNKFQMSSIKPNVLNVVILSEHLPVYGRSQKSENIDRGKKLKSRKVRRALDSIIGIESKLFIFGIAKESKT